MSAEAAEHRLLRPVDKRRDHARGGGRRDRAVVLIYGDYLCPYCRRLRLVLDRLRKALGERMTYVFRHFPNERVHPGAEFAAIASEAAARQGKFWQMHDGLYGHEPPITEATVRQIAKDIGLDMKRFERDVADPKLKARVEEDLDDGRRNGVTATPTIFIDGVRYDGAWDFYSMLEALERPVGARVQRTARAFANLPASAGIALLIAAGLALVFANSPLAPMYRNFVEAQLGIGPQGGGVWLSVADWCSEGLLAIFFLIVGLEIRREMTAGSLSDPRAAAAPVLAALGGILAPAAIYLAFNPGHTAAGWSAPADTGIAFTLGIMAVFGQRISAGLKVFVAAYAVADDIFAILILAVFYPHDLRPLWLIGSVGLTAAMWLLNRWRVYAGWPYRIAAVGLWLTLHLAGVNGALAGIVLAALLPTRPTPTATPLLDRPRRARARRARAAARRRRRQAPRAGAGLGLGEPQPLGRRGAAAVAGRTGRARPRAVVDLLRAADVRLHRGRRAAGRRPRRPGRLARAGGCRRGTRDRQAAGNPGRGLAGDQGADRDPAGRAGTRLRGRRVPLRDRRPALDPAGRAGFRRPGPARAGGGRQARHSRRVRRGGGAGRRGAGLQRSPGDAGRAGGGRRGRGLSAAPAAEAVSGPRRG